jgi:type IV pilus assembly protein PilV
MSLVLTTRLRRPVRTTFVRRQRGMSLIESLVAMVILAFGVLGMVGVQLRGMVDSQNTAQITMATQMANDLFERIKTNPNAYLIFNTTFSAPTPLATAQWAWLGNYALAWTSDDPADSTACGTGYCDAAARATWDLIQWRKNRFARMPGSGSQVLVSPDDPRQIIVIIGWLRKSMKNADGSASVVTPYAPTIPNVTMPSACGATGTHDCHVIYGQP